MKSTKKILSAILTVALLASFFVMPVSAAVSDDAQTCAAIDVLRGDGSGVTEVYLAKNTNRSQGAKILLRLMGLEVEADAYTGTATFSDASDATDYWQPMLAYLKANPDVGFQGYPDGTFAPNKIMTAQEIYKVLLVSLGYVENVDFTWGEVFSFAASVGMTQLAGTAEITNDDLATALVEALQANKKDGQQLISFLIDEGVVDLIDAQNAGLVATTLTITDAFASGAKEITANLNMAAPAGTTVKIMRGSVTWPADVTWESGNKVVKFSRDFNYTPGEYTVVIGESTYPVTVEAESLIGISIGADYIYPQAGQDLQVSFYNQYGEPMTIPGSAVIIVLNPSKGTQLTTINMGDTIKVDASDSNEVEGGDSLMITLYHNTFSQTKTIAVYDDPVIKTFNVAGLEIKDDAPKIDENTTGHKLVIDATDQYGNPYILTAGDLSTFGGTVHITSSNDLSVPDTNFSIDADGKLVFNVLAAGQARITIIIPTQAIVEFYDITVSEPTTLETLIINAASGMITSGTPYDLTTFAYDQLGASLPLLGNFDISKFSMFSTDQSVAPNGSIQYDAVEGELFFLPGATGSATITYYYNGIYQGALPVTVYDAAEPQYIQSIDFPEYFEAGASKAISVDDMVVIDQYGQVFDMDTLGYSIDIQATSGTTVTEAGGTFTAGSTEGATTFTLTVLDGVTSIPGSQHALQITVINTGVATFKLETVGLLYGDPTVAGMPKYHKTLEINGEHQGKSVVLYIPGGTTKPSSIDTITSSNPDIKVDVDTLDLYALDGGTSTIRIFVNGVEEDSILVTADDEVPVVTTMVFSPNPETRNFVDGSFSITEVLTIKDQYGVDITSTASDLTYGSNDSNIVMINSSGVITPVAVGTTNVWVIHPSKGSAILSLTIQ